MALNTSSLVKTGLLLWGCVLAAQLNGCATATSSLECGIESMHPTVMAAVDSFESSALAIKLSNQVLLEMPISEQDRWPEKLYGAPTGAGLVMMGLSLFSASQGIAIPFEMDRQTGLPRPTSALYIFLKERERMLRTEASREDLQFFASQPTQVIVRELPSHRRQAGEPLIDEHVYRNPLMAFGVVTANQDEMIRVQQDLELLSQGFKQCDAWVHASREGDIKPAVCRDPALRQDSLQIRMTTTSFPAAQPAAPPRKLPDDGPALIAPRSLRDTFGEGTKQTDARPDPPGRGLGKKRQATTKRDKRSETVTLAGATATKHSAMAPEPPATIESAPDSPDQGQGVIYVNELDRQLAEKGTELEIMRKNYGKLAGRVYNAAVAGADFTTAALVKLGCAIVNGTKALSNIQNEFKGARGAYNLALVASRVRMIVNAFGYYQHNLGLQVTAYSTMYQQIKGTYPDIQDNDPERRQKQAQALQRIDQATALLQELAPKLEQLAQGEPSPLTDHDLARLQVLARRYPDQQHLQQELLLAWNGSTNR